jgi:radical SAM protein with 4Fe4S-binding SPASM domain
VDGTPGLTDKHRVPRNPGRPVSNSVSEAAGRLRNWNLPFGVLFVVTASSVGMETQILEYLQSLRPETIAFTPCLDRGPAIAPEAYARFVNAFFEAWLSLGHVDPEIRMFTYYRQRITDSVQMPIPCEWGNDCPNCICISADGQVWVCDVFMGKEKGHLGDIRRQSLSDIVLSEPFQDFVRARSKLADKCRECEALEVCRGGCPYRRDDGIDYFCEATLTAFHRTLGFVQSTISEIGARQCGPDGQPPAE